MNSEDVPPSSHICSKHFTDDCFIRHNSRVALKSHSVPTLFIDPLHSVKRNPTRHSRMSQGIQEVNIKLQPGLPENESNEENHQQNNDFAAEGFIPKEEIKIEFTSDGAYDNTPATDTANHQQSNSTTDKEDLILKKEIKTEFTSDDTYDNIPATDAGNYQQNNSTTDNEALTVEKEITFTSDDAYDNTECLNSQVLEAQEFNSKFINVYDEMIDIKHNMTTNKVKLEVLDDVRYGVSTGASNNENIKYNMQTDKVKFEIFDDVGYGVNPEASNDGNMKYNTQTHKVKLEVSDDVGISTYLEQDNGEKLFKCNKCDFQCRNKGSLNLHVLKHYRIRDLKRFSCDKCDYTCYKGKHLRNHLKFTHSERKYFACDECNIKYTSINKLNSHLSKHKNPVSESSVNFLVKVSENVWSCGMCNTKTKLRSGLIRHVINKHNEKLFSCNQCDFKTYEYRLLIRHLLSHTACVKCSHYQFKDKAALKKHLLKHFKCKNENNSLSCGHCKNKVTMDRNIDNNMQTDKVKLNMLDDVGSGVSPGTSNNANIKYNRQTDKVILEVLDDGGYGFSPEASNNGNIKYNMQTDKVKLEVLDDFGFGISPGPSNDGKYKYNIHTDEVKLEVSDDVGMSTYLEQDNGEKLFKCNKCDVQCRNKGILNTHVLKHYRVRDLKRFLCDKCDYTCYKGRLLINHLKFTHSEGRYV